MRTNWAPVLASACGLAAKDTAGGDTQQGASMRSTAGAAPQPSSSSSEAPAQEAHPDDGTGSAGACATAISSAEPRRVAGAYEGAAASGEQGESAGAAEQDHDLLWEALAEAARSTALLREAASDARGDGCCVEGCYDCMGGSGGLHSGHTVTRKPFGSLFGDSSDSSDGDCADSWAGYSFQAASAAGGDDTALSAPTFNGTFRAQRARRTVRVVRSGLRAAPSQARSSGGPAAAAAAAPPTAALAAASAPGLALPSAGGGSSSPRRSRKKRAAASLMDGGTAFNGAVWAPTRPMSSGAAEAPAQEQAALVPSSSSSAASSRPASSDISPSLRAGAFGSSLVSPLHAAAADVTAQAKGCMPAPAPCSAGSVPATAADGGDGVTSGSLPAMTSGCSAYAQCWARPPLLLAAATGRADVVRHLLGSAAAVGPYDGSPEEYG